MEDGPRPCPMLPVDPVQELDCRSSVLLPFLQVRRMVVYQEVFLSYSSFDVLCLVLRIGDENAVVGRDERNVLVAPPVLVAHDVGVVEAARQDIDVIALFGEDSCRLDDIVFRKPVPEVSRLKKLLL